MTITCDGELSITPEGYPACVGTWIDEPSQLNQLFELLNAAFSTPEAADIQLAFMAGITIPMICYLTAWAYGMVIQFATSENHYEN